MKIDLANFEIPNIDSWKNQVLFEAKDNDALLYRNEIENIDIDISNKNNQHFSFSTFNSIADWDVVSSFLIEGSFNNNKSILKSLEHGSNHLYLDIDNNNLSWNKVFDGIIIDIIHVTIRFRNTEQIRSFKAYLPKNLEEHVTICIDPFEIDYFKDFKDSAVSFIIDGFSIEQIGASTNQQLAVVLNCAEYILEQCENPKRIKFQLGIGNDFLIETSKTRALKWLWKHVLKKNNYSCNYTFVLGTIGWTNKSLKDPHMNLLRQTTEGLSAVSGGVSALLILPVSALTDQGPTWFDRRMSLNISHILKEESFLSKVADPLNGSYIVEMLTKQIINNSWNLFLEIYDKSPNEIVALMTDKINLIRKKKIDNFINGEKQLIGINLFKNKKEEEYTFNSLPNYLETPFLIYENLLEDE